MATEPAPHVNAKVAAGLIGRSLHTLRRARHDRPDLRMPPYVRVGRAVRYPLAELLAWARWHAVELNWSDFPTHYELSAMRAHETAGLPLPPGLRLRVQLPISTR